MVATGGKCVKRSSGPAGVELHDRRESRKNCKPETAPGRLRVCLKHVPILSASQPIENSRDRHPGKIISSHILRQRPCAKVKRLWSLKLIHQSALTFSSFLILCPRAPTTPGPRPSPTSRWAAELKSMRETIWQTCIGNGAKE